MGDLRSLEDKPLFVQCWLKVKALSRVVQGWNCTCSKAAVDWSYRFLATSFYARRTVIWRKKNLNNALYLSIRGHLTEKPPVCKSTTKWYKLYKVAPWEEVFTCQAADFSVDPSAVCKGQTNLYWLPADYLSACWREGDLSHKSFSGSWQWYEGGVHDPNTVRQGEKSWRKVGRLTPCQPPRQCERGLTSKKEKKKTPQNSHRMSICGGKFSDITAVCRRTECTWSHSVKINTWANTDWM